MTTGSTPREPWDDDRLDAAFAARAASTSTPVDLTGATNAALRRRPVTVPIWRRILAPAAVVVLAVGVVGTGVVLREEGHAAPTPEPTDRAPQPSPSSPATVLGLPVMTVSEAIDVRDSGDDDREIAVRAWFAPNYPLRACGRATDKQLVSPLQEACPDRLLWLMLDPESLTSVTSTGISWRGPTGPAINPELDDVDMSWAEPFDDPARLAELIVIGHFDDSRAGTCPPAEETACRDRFVVDRVDSVDGVNQPLSIVDRVDGAEVSSPDDIRAAVDAGARVRPILSMVIVDARVEGLSDGPSSTVWVAQVLGEPWVEHHVVYDGTDEVFMVRLSGPPKFALPRPVLDIAVISVPELIARRAADPSPEEIAVHGWILTSNVVYDCALDPDPHPLGPWCQTPVFLMDQPEEVTGLSPDGPYVLPLLGPDTHYQVDAPRNTPVEVIAIGHLDDHRSSSCPINGQPSCRRQFVVDRIVPAAGPFEDLPEPWRIRGAASADPSSDPAAVIRVLERFTGDITVVSLGYIDGDALAQIEPAVRDQDDFDAVTQSRPVWVIRALVAGDTPPATARTFIVPDHPAGEPIVTIWEAAEDGMAPIIEPGATWPPAGATVIELKSFVGRDRPPARVAVVDESGQLIAVREAGGSDPPVTVQGSDRAALIRDSDGALRLVWIGGPCDGDMTVTIDAGVRRIMVDGGRRPACDAMAIGRDLVLDFSEPIRPAGVEVLFTETLIPG